MKTEVHPVKTITQPPTIRYPFLWRSDLDHIYIRTEFQDICIHSPKDKTMVGKTFSIVPNSSNVKEVWNKRLHPDTIVTLQNDAE